MQIYDTRLKQKVAFESIRPKQARIYVCGPTVYDDAHLGHARSSIVFDLLRRTLSLSGYAVRFVKNITDIDDKIIKKAREKGVDITSIASSYIASYQADMLALNVLEPDSAPQASKSLEAIATMIEALLEKEVAYRLENGDIYLHVASDARYGSVSARGAEEGSQARIQAIQDKRDERDFALWKAYKGADDVGYESRLGRGRPGWHIECSAMIEESLAYEGEDFGIDIHGGGSDLLFPHHENEASQTRCATGREIAKYWMHNGFVNINGEKMSKSLGNSFFVKDALLHYGGEVLRNYLLGVHYRAVLHFSEEDLLSAKKRLDKLYRLKQRVQAESNALDSHAVLDSHAEGLRDEQFCKSLLESMQDDLNISKTLSVLEEMLSQANAALDSHPKDRELKARIRGNLTFISELLGLGGGDSVAYFQQGVSTQERAVIEGLITQRLEAKKQKDFAQADALREELHTLGVEVRDIAGGGCIWEKL